MTQLMSWMAERRWLVGVVAAAVVVLVALVVAVALIQRLYTGEVLPGVHVDGIAVGGADRDELGEIVTERAEDRAAQRIEILGEDDTITVTHGELGESYDVATAVDRAWRQGRRGFVTRLTTNVRAWRGNLDVQIALPRRVDTDQLDDRVRRIAETFDRDEQEADVVFVVDDDNVEVEVTEPEPGVTVLTDPLRDDLLDLIDERAAPHEPAGDTATLDLPLAEPTEPAITAADVQAVVPLAEEVVVGPVILRHPAGGDHIELSPVELTEVLRIDRDADAAAGDRLRLVGDADSLEELVADLDLTVDPVEATVTLADGEPQIEGGTRGFEPDLDAATDRVLALATGAAGDDDVLDDDVPDDVERPDRVGELPGASIEPDLSRQEVKELGIEEVVSSFSTPLTPGQPRNENLALAAQLLDGALLLPGERLSLNERLGPRTAERGFIENGYIDEDGELVSVVGGGVSQMATTLMNAAWFAGIEIVQFQPHSLYFERYPEGREATLAWEAIDLVIENDSPYGMLISAGATEQELGVDLWSTPWAEVTTETSDRLDVVEGDERDGFRVIFSRTITYPDGSSRTDGYTHRYDPED